MRSSSSRQARLFALVTVLVCESACGSSSRPTPDTAADSGPDKTDTPGPADDVDGAVEVPLADGAVPLEERDASLVQDAAAPMVDAGPVASSTLRARVCGDRTSWPSPLPAADKRRAERVGNQRFGFIEGPVWVDSLGALLFSDMDFAGGDELGPPSKIRKLVPPDQLSVLVESSGSNGLGLFDADTLVAATHDRRSLSFFDPKTGARQDLAVSLGGKAFHSTNDVAVREDGMVYFTDPDYQLGARARELDNTGVYRVALRRPPAASAEAVLVDNTLRQPNGVALSPDQKTLYVGSSGSEIWKWDVAADGSVSNRRQFARPGASDGLTVDCAGNLYVTAGDVQVFAPNGDRLGALTLGGRPSNVAFGGAEHRTLYITAESALYALELQIPGYPF